MEQKIATALEAFYSGSNCAQSVIKAYVSELKFDEQQALDMALGFGGGMGKTQKTCGAVTGAYMIIGLKNASLIDGLENQKKDTPAVIQDYRKLFIQRHQTDQCIHLLSCDLRTEAGQQTFKDQKLKDKVCSKCIESSIKILEDLYKK